MWRLANKFYDRYTKEHFIKLIYYIPTREAEEYFIWNLQWPHLQESQKNFQPGNLQPPQSPKNQRVNRNQGRKHPSNKDKSRYPKNYNLPNPRCLDTSIRSITGQYVSTWADQPNIVGPKDCNSAEARGKDLKIAFMHMIKVLKDERNKPHKEINENTNSGRKWRKLIKIWKWKYN